MRFPKYGHYALDASGNILELFATGSWNLATAEEMATDMHILAARFNNKPWAAIMDGRRWILSTPECQNCLTETILKNIELGLKRAAYVLDPGMVKKAQLERTHPASKVNIKPEDYERRYFTSYFEALKWLKEEGYSPYDQ